MAKSFLHEMEKWNKADKNYAYGTGQRGAKAWMEDVFITLQSINKKVTCGAVFDGHGGYNGMVASIAARTELEDFMTENNEICEKWTVEEWKKILYDLFSRMHSRVRESILISEGGPDKNDKKKKRYLDEKGIVRCATGDPVHGGTTATLVFALSTSPDVTTLIVGNTGDSDAILVPFQGEWSRLSVDHGPDSVDEYKRIAELNSEEFPTKLLFVYDKTNVYKKYLCPQIFDEKTCQKIDKYVKNPWQYGLHPTNVRYEAAVYAVTPQTVTRDMTCIAMTRSLGDFYAHQFGLSHIPSVNSFELKGEQRNSLVAIGSDGVWDCWKYEHISRHTIETLTNFQERNPISSFFKDGKQIIYSLDVLTNQLIKQSIHKAIESFGVRHYDDACLVLLHLNYQPPTSSQISSTLSNKNNNIHNINTSMNDEDIDDDSDLGDGYNQGIASNTMSRIIGLPKMEP